MSNPGTARKYDPKELEHEFVTTKISIRALAGKHSVSFSTVAKRARDEDWYGKRLAYESALSRRTYEKMAEDIGTQESVIREEMVMILRATVRKYAADLAAGKVVMNVKDVVAAVQTLAHLLDGPGGNTDGPGIIEGQAFKPDATHLRRVADAARRRVATGDILEESASGQPEGTLPN